MLSLALAASFFAGIHLLVSGTALRTALVSRVGLRIYTALFSLASVLGLAWLIWAYGKVRVPMVTPLSGYRAIAAALIFMAFAFMVLGLLSRSPTAIGGEKLLDRDDPARGIHRITRHPILWGIALWAATHMAFNSGAAHLLFFGAFLVVALAGTFSIDAKRAREYGEKWQRYAARTSNLPFAAILHGQNQLVWSELSEGKLLAALAAYGAFALLHLRFFGVAVL